MLINPEDLKIVRMKRAINALIGDIKNKSFPVEKIIVFGSALGEGFNEHSDLDICVVSNNELNEKQKHTLENYITNMLQGEVAVDFIYCTNETLQTGSQVHKSIREKGRVMYEQV